MCTSASLQQWRNRGSPELGQKRFRPDTFFGFKRIEGLFCVHLSCKPTVNQMASSRDSAAHWSVVRYSRTAFRYAAGGWESSAIHEADLGGAFEHQPDIQVYVPAKMAIGYLVGFIRRRNLSIQAVHTSYHLWTKQFTASKVERTNARTSLWPIEQHTRPMERVCIATESLPSPDGRPIPAKVCVGFGNSAGEDSGLV